MGGVIEFLRTLYAVGITQYALGGVLSTQYALSNKLGVIERLSFESMASTLNHELSTLN